MIMSSVSLRYNTPWSVARTSQPSMRHYSDKDVRLLEKLLKCVHSCTGRLSIPLAKVGNLVPFTPALTAKYMTQPALESGGLPANKGSSLLRAVRRPLRLGS